MTAYVLLAALVLLAVVAPRWGADSRDGRDWQAGCDRDRSR
jgi:hypothetical protein